MNLGLAEIPAGSRITQTDLAGSKKLRTVSMEAKFDCQSRQETKIGGLVFSLVYRQVHCLGA